jgi:Protein of unknown function (DUF4242)
MKKYIIERKLPGAGNMTAEELREVVKTSIEGLASLGKPYTWVQSFVAEDKIYCVHIAESEDDVRQHAKFCKFPVNTIEKIFAVIDPATE